MHTTHDLIELAKQRLALANNLALPMSDYRLGKLMGIRQSTVSAWRTRTRSIGTEFAAQFADACGLPREYVYACIEHEREKNPAVLRVLESIAATFRKSAAAIVAVGLFLALPIFPGSNANAASSGSIHYPNKRRRRERELTTNGDANARLLPSLFDSIQRYARHRSLRRLRVDRDRAGDRPGEILEGERLVNFYARWKNPAKPTSGRRRLLAATAATVLALNGCAALHSPAELSWQALHVADAAMTNNIVDDPCFKEGHPITRAFVGEQPSHARVAAWAVGESLAHAAVSDFLLTHGHSTAFTVWESITIADTSLSMGRGLSIGVRFWGANKAANCAASH